MLVGGEWGRQQKTNFLTLLNEKEQSAEKED
jgi:hypothetical protein